MRALLAEARRLGVQIVLSDIETPGIRGYWDPSQRLAVLSLGLDRPQLQEAAGHELGHAYFGDDCSTPEAERRADRRAALLLVDPDRYAAAELINPHPNFIAAELGQTAHIITVWREWWLPQIHARRHSA